MFASDWNTLSKPNNRVVGPNGVLMGGQDGSGNLPSPSAIANLAAWYDVSDFSRLTIDGSNRVQLIADKSAYSAENCLVLPGVSGNYASTTKYIPSAGVFRIESKVTWASYTPSGTQTLTATFAPSSSNRSWAVFLLSTGIIRVSLSSNGLLAGTTNVDSTTALDDGTKYVAIEIDLATPTTGSIKYEKSTDGVTWSSICAPVSYTQVALYDATASLEVGTNNGGTLNLAQNNTHWIKYYYNGALVRNFDATVQAKLATSWTAATTGETWTINSTAIALPARIHGARDLYMGTQASQPYYAAWSGTNYGYLNGASGAYFSTPDSAALSPTAEFEVIAEVTRVAGVSQYIIAQDDGGANRAYYVIINTSGNLVIRTVDTNAGVTFHTSTATMPVGNNFIKVTVNQDNGSTSETNFYTGTSRSGPWSALGAPVTGTARLDIVNKSNTVTIGNQGSQYGTGNVSYVSFSTTIGGAATAVFNASDYPSTGGSTFVSSATGETWTINGGATIVDRTQIIHDGTNDYVKSPAFPLSQPENLYIGGLEQITWVSADTIIDGDALNSMRIRQTTAGSSGDTSLYAGSSGPDINITVKTTSIVSAKFNSTTSSIRQKRQSAVVADAGASSGNGLTVGASGNATGFGNISWFELLIYDTTAHTTAQQDRLALYFARKWRIPNV